MRIETNHLVIRDLEQKDKENIFKIIWQPGCRKYMRDWSDNIPSAESLEGYVNWHQTQRDSTDMYKAKRYAITLKGENNLIGCIGMGYDDEINEVEIAYFLDLDYQHKGYAKEAILAFFSWCMSVSDLKYMVATIDETNVPSQRAIEAAGFSLYEKRTTVGYHKSNMTTDTYHFYKKLRA